jgi:hypothetical protein
MCAQITKYHVVSFLDLAQAGIFINETGINIPLDNANAVLAIRSMADAVRKEARELREQEADLMEQIKKVEREQIGIVKPGQSIADIWNEAEGL